MVNESANWVIMVFAGLFGLGIVYTIARITIASVSPETEKRIQLYFILRDAKRHFSFLLEKGYTISHLDYVAHHHAGWHFQLDSPDNRISIVLDQQQGPLLAFGKDKTDKKYQIHLMAMIYYLTDKKVFIGNSYYDTLPSRNHSFKHTAEFLKTHINQIENYSRDEFEKTKNELSKSQEEYGDLLVQEFEQLLKLKRQ